MNFSGKKVLITAGPTWVAIDEVRVISNIATGKTGILLAELFNRRKAKVTLLLGPGYIKETPKNKDIKVIPFKFYDELQGLTEKILTSNKFDIIIHSAAVSDYRPKVTHGAKIKSNLKELNIKLIPTAKIIDSIKRKAPSAFLVGFKFEVSVSKEDLIKKALKLIKQNNLDLAVANTIENHGYKAYILNKLNCYGPFENKTKLANMLIRKIGEHLCLN